MNKNDAEITNNPKEELVGKRLDYSKQGSNNCKNTVESILKMIQKQNDERKKVSDSN